MITRPPPQRSPPKRPRFLWRGLLIVLPALLMAGFGFVSLRQDRLLVRHQAAEEAEKLAAELVQVVLPAALYVDIQLPDTMDASNASRHDPILAADHEGIITALTDDAGLLIYPPPPIWPLPEPLELELLDAQRLEIWTTARHELFMGDDPAMTSELFEGLIEHGLPERFEALARFHLFDLSLRLEKIDRGLEHFEQIRRRFGAVKTESGLPLRLLAEWCCLRLTQSEPSAPFNPDLNWLCAHAVLEPGPVSATIVELVRLIGMDNPQAQAAHAWTAVWDAHQRARGLDVFLNGIPPTEPAATRPLDTSWVAFDNRDFLVLRQPTGNRVWRLAWSKEALHGQVRRALDVVSIPGHLGCSVDVGGKTMTSVESKAPPIASSTASVDRSTGAELTATVWLANPDLLYARQRTRTWWIGALIAVSAAAVLCGVMAAWRGFREQQRLTEMKGNFVSSVSHEMRAPIASVRLMAEELVDRGTSDPTKAGEYHGYILQECRRLSALIENVLDFSKHEQGRKQYRFESTDLVPVVDETIHVMRSYAADRKVTIERRLDGVPFDLDLDAAAIQQVLVNLLDNAIKHSPPGATVEVALAFPERVQVADGNPGANGTLPVRLSVRDEGPGIPAEEQGLIFQRFYRRGTELRRETQGIGLGLAIVQYIVEAHGGRASVESQVGKGSRFVVELPSKGENRP